MKDIENKGKEVEDLVEKICTNMFFSDFTIRNNKFKNTSKKEKEAADILILFDNVLLAIQVKTKINKEEVSEKSDINLKRIDNRIEGAINQFKTLKRAIANSRFKEVETTRGYKIPFDSKKVKKIIGIVIFDLIGEEALQPEEQITILNGFEFRHDIPIHIFKRNEFETISTELDTLPDFVQYVETREALFSRDLFAVSPLELNLLALYKVKREDLQLAIQENSLVIIDDGYWEWYQKDCRELIEKRDIDNKPSYLIDRVINWLHSIVGFDPQKHGIKKPFEISEEKSEGTVQDYLSVATELAKTPRLIRRKLGEKLLECLERAERNGLAFTVSVNQQDNSAVVILSSSKSREERSQILYKVSAMAYCKYNLTKIAGFATESLDTVLRSYDVILLSNVEFPNRDDLLEDAKRAFGIASEAKFYEFLNSPDKEIK